MATSSPAVPSATRSWPTRIASSHREILARLSLTPFASQASIIARHSSTSRAIGFWRSMCLPAAAAARTFGRWAVCGVAMTTASMSERSSRASIDGSASAPNSDASDGARVPPATTTILARPGACSEIATAWIWAIWPAPISPNPTVIVPSSDRPSLRLDGADVDCRRRLAPGDGHLLLRPDRDQAELVRYRDHLEALLEVAPGRDAIARMHPGRDAMLDARATDALDRVGVELRFLWRPIARPGRHPE